MKYTYTFDNDTGPHDDYYVEFLTIYDPNGTTMGKINREADAIKIVDLLNSSISAEENLDASRENTNNISGIIASNGTACPPGEVKI